jgi:hypothetical protein
MRFRLARLGPNKQASLAIQDSLDQHGKSKPRRAMFPDRVVGASTDLDELIAEFDIQDPMATKLFDPSDVSRHARRGRHFW